MHIVCDVVALTGAAHEELIGFAVPDEVPAATCCILRDNEAHFLQQAIRDAHVSVEHLTMKVLLALPFHLDLPPVASICEHI